MIKVFRNEKRKKSQHIFLLPNGSKTHLYDSHTSVHYVDLELAGDFLMEYIADGKDIAKCCQNQKIPFHSQSQQQQQRNCCT